LLVQLIINAIVDDLLDETLSALADPTRRRVVELLRSERLRATVISDRLGMTPAATSRHLRVLRTAGLVAVESVEDDARARVYRLTPERLVALGGWLDQVEAHWTEQLASFKQHAEARSRSDDA
jgi:DNA-binding transcriptional ArsR family regulator